MVFQARRASCPLRSARLSLDERVVDLLADELPAQVSGNLAAMFGQFCLLLPEQDTVVLTTAAAQDLQPILDLVWATLLPGLKNTEALPADPAGARRLSERPR